VCRWYFKTLIKYKGSGYHIIPVCLQTCSDVISRVIVICQSTSCHCGNRRYWNCFWHTLHRLLVTWMVSLRILCVSMVEATTQWKVIFLCKTKLCQTAVIIRCVAEPCVYIYVCLFTVFCVSNLLVLSFTSGIVYTTLFTYCIAVMATVLFYCY